MKKIANEDADKVLRSANGSPAFINDEIGCSIDSILRGSHKTYRYILFTALLAKSTNVDIDVLSLQAQDESEGAYDARSLCHSVVVPFEREVYPNSLGGSNEPFLNKPARFPRLSINNAVRRGSDYETLKNLIETLSKIKSREQANVYLSSALYSLSCIYRENKEKYILPDLSVEGGCGAQRIMDYISVLIENSNEGEICPLVVSAIERIYYGGNRIVTPHKVNESGASSKEIGDIDIFDTKEQLVSSIEVKDKDFTKEDVEHAITKFARSRIEKSMFIFGKDVDFDRRDVYREVALLGNQGYFCSVISIEDFVRMRLYSMNNDVGLDHFIRVLVYYAININAKESTLDWIKKCAEEFA